MAETREICFPTALESGIPRSRCQQVGSFWGPSGKGLILASLLACRGPPLEPLYHTCPMCPHTSSASSSKGSRQTASGPTLKGLSELTHLVKDLFSRSHYWGVGILTWIWGGHEVAHWQKWRGKQNHLERTFGYICSLPNFLPIRIKKWLCRCYLS